MLRTWMETPMNAHGHQWLYLSAILTNFSQYQNVIFPNKSFNRIYFLRISFYQYICTCTVIHVTLFNTEQTGETLFGYDSISELQQKVFSNVYQYQCYNMYSWRVIVL